MSWYNEFLIVYIYHVIKNISELNMIYYSNTTKKITYKCVSKKDINIDKRYNGRTLTRFICFSKKNG